MYFYLLVSVLFLIYVNGANDNFKGVATLYGSRIWNYKKALVWSSITTLIGSVSSLYFAKNLYELFTFPFLYTDEYVNLIEYILPIILGSAFTVLVATVLGFPISTTHSLIGAITGIVFYIHKGFNMNSKIVYQFFLPLIFSPLISIIFTIVFFIFIKNVLYRYSVILSKKVYSKCICIDSKRLVTNTNFLFQNSHIVYNDSEFCSRNYNNKILFNFTYRKIDILHFISAGFLCFARGLNDTPKLAGIIFWKYVSSEYSLFLVSIIMVLGGIFHSRKVAYNISKKITPMDAIQGFSANFISFLIVFLASILGLPVSTTHTSIGSIFGIGLINKKINGILFRDILIAWFITLPFAAISSILFFYILNIFL